MSISYQRLGQAPQAGARQKYLNLETPEGVTLQFKLPSLATRASSVILDYFFLLLLILICGVVGLFALKVLPTKLVITAIILLTFFIRQGYFIFFELKTQGSTPGKRQSNLKVIDRSGQPLTAQAIFLRNLLREVEFTLPMAFLFQDKDFYDLETWLAGFVFFIAFFSPALNRQHLRIGDLIANTIVVEIPKSQLAVDLSDDAAALRGAPPARFSFTKEQLDIYGIYELQQLEEVLRRRGHLSPVAINSLYLVIVNKINWPIEQQILNPTLQQEFLRAFYAAQRDYLEKRMQLGERREFKRGVY